jgi:hypothetical protein
MREPRFSEMSQAAYMRRQQLYHKYGLTMADYNAMLAAQDMACAICGQRPQKTLYVDHDHETGEVRGLLCVRCNTGLGMFRDSIRLLASAIVYLEEHGKDFS